MYSIYWIHHPTHVCMKTQGYIGITKNVDKRWKEHKQYAKAPYTKCAVIERAISKYGDLFVWEIVLEDVEKELAEFVEFELRPTTNIGWNLAVGGCCATLGYKHTEETKNKLSGFNNYRAKKANIYNANTEELVAENVCLSEWCKNNNRNAAHLGGTATGRYKAAKGLYARYIQEKDLHNANSKF